ncbi:MAG: hypothetical protein ACPGJV_00810 [Bacteriovoracaceae bacterium]
MKIMYVLIITLLVVAGKFFLSETVEKEAPVRTHASVNKIGAINHKTDDALEKSHDIVTLKTASIKKVHSFSAEGVLTNLKSENVQCLKDIERIFADQNYIDPEYKMYSNFETMIETLDDVMEKVLINKTSKRSFLELKKDFNSKSEKNLIDPSWKNLLSNIDVCRENEIFYFLETIFEASTIHKWTEEQRELLLQKLFLGSLQILKDQHTLSNILLVSNILKQGLRYLSKDEYLQSEAEALFDDFIRQWNYFGSFSKDESPDLQYFRNYFSDAEYYASEVKALFERVSVQ